MLTGIILAILAGVLLGLYALPGKFTKGFQFENTWGLFFFLNLLVVPVISALLFIKGSAAIVAAIPAGVLMQMAVAGVLWGIGVTMWGKAINYIGLSLGFSIFIGTVILVGSFLPFVVNGLPATNIFMILIAGLLVVLLGVAANGRAGVLRQKDESLQEASSGKSMTAGIVIAIIGGILATGFSFANAVGQSVIDAASQAQGNASWITGVMVMCIIYISAGIFVSLYFLWQLTCKKLWHQFKTPQLAKNVGLITLMAVFNFAAAVVFAYAALKLGKMGGSVGYAIFNTVCVAVAIVSGLLTREWVNASVKAKRYLYLGLSAMILGVVIIAFGNGVV